MSQHQQPLLQEAYLKYAENELIRVIKECPGKSESDARNIVDRRWNTMGPTLITFYLAQSRNLHRTTPCSVYLTEQLELLKLESKQPDIIQCMERSLANWEDLYAKKEIKIYLEESNRQNIPFDNLMEQVIEEMDGHR